MVTEPMALEAVLTLFGSCLGVGCLLGGFVTLCNSWLP